MSDGPEWFAPKRYGYGAGLPISWQGWALTIGFIALAVALGALFHNEPLSWSRRSRRSSSCSSCICARTTRGGWRWRWGKRTSQPTGRAAG